MSLTGTQIPQGTILAQDDEILLEGGPGLYFMDRRGSYRANPDGDGFYWGLSGSATYNVFEVGCYENFSMADNVEMNDVRCDRIGVVATVQKRNYLEFTFDLKSFFPFTVLRYMVNGGAVTTNVADEAEKFGIGPINNNNYFKAFFPLVYDEDAGDHLSVTVHRAQFVDGFEWGWNYGEQHSMNITLRAFADKDRPTAQRFATILRVDPSEL